jgi:hypothetical protein
VQLAVYRQAELQIIIYDLQLLQLEKSHSFEDEGKIVDRTKGEKILREMLQLTSDLKPKGLAELCLAEYTQHNLIQCGLPLQQKYSANLIHSLKGAALISQEEVDNLVRRDISDLSTKQKVALV